MGVANAELLTAGRAAVSGCRRTGTGTRFGWLQSGWSQAVKVEGYDRRGTAERRAGGSHTNGGEEAGGFLLVREVNVRLHLLALLEDQGQTNTPHSCVQQKGKNKLDSREN